MAISLMFSSEPYEIGARLYRTLQGKAALLEIAALRDEIASANLEDPDQMRRQRLLIQAQRDDAERLRTFLVKTCPRPCAGHDRG